MNGAVTPQFPEFRILIPPTESHQERSSKFAILVDLQLIAVGYLQLRNVSVRPGQLLDGRRDGRTPPRRAGRVGR
jgi:hypothetical protein